MYACTCAFGLGPVSGWGFYAIRYELFTLFLLTIYAICAKNRTVIYGLHPTKGFSV
jgi:hypothetical protein